MKCLLLSLVLLVGCSVDKETVFVTKGTPGGNGSSCTTYPVEGGANVKCGDSITFIASGSKGDQGSVGDSNDGRVAELERRMDLKDQLDLMRDELIATNDAAVNARIGLVEANLTSLINDERTLREAADAAQQDALARETQARIDGDSALAASIAAEAAARVLKDNELADALAASIAAQTVVNFSVQAQVDAINSQFPEINNTLSSLQSQVNSSSTNISSLQAQVNILSTDITGLKLRVSLVETGIAGLNSSYTALNGTVTGLSSSVTTLDNTVAGLSTAVSSLQTQLNQEGVKVYKCNASTSKERIFKINDKFYAVMNYVTTENVQVITGSSSQTYATPKLCAQGGSGNGALQLPNSSGDCGNGAIVVPNSGQTITVPAYSVGSVPVVTKVQMALEKLENGSYVTTDGAAACTFSISGSTSTNLIPVQ